MKEKRPAVADTGDLSEYERFLLHALLELAAEEAGKPLSAAERRALTLTFLEDIQQAKRERVNAKSRATRARKQRGAQLQEDASFQWRQHVTKRRAPR